MTTSPNLMKAILAMDVYSRGYNAGILGLSDATNGTAKLSDYTIIATSSSLLDNNENNNIDGPIGFYSVAYQLASGEK